MKSFIAYRHEQLDPRNLRDALPCAHIWLGSDDC